MARYYETLFRESGTGKELTFHVSGNTRTSGARAARRRLREVVGDTSKWYEVTTTFLPKGGARP